MPCPKDGTNQPLVMGVPVADWSKVHPYFPSGIYIPARVQDLVVIVQDIEAKNAKGKAVGSVWSLSEAPDSDGFAINTNELRLHLSRPFPPPPFALPTTRPVIGSSPPQTESTFRSKHDAPLLELWAGDNLPAAGRFLIHVEAGIKVRQLLADLASAGLALPTMGAAGGQSLAGAISTSTHGADVKLQLLGDAVRAVHLVGPGGQEWWIEGNAGAGRRGAYGSWPDWCADMRVVRDSDFLHSVIVGVGRFGILYSMVLEVVPQFRLEERTREVKWSQMRSALATAINKGQIKDGTVFFAPTPCAVIAKELHDLKNGSHSEFNPATKQWVDVPSTPSTIAAKQKELDECLEKAKKLDDRPPRFANVVIDAASGSRTWMIRRWLTSNATDVANDGFDALGFFCTHDGWAVTLVQAAVAAAAQTLRNIAAGTAIFIPIAGPVIAEDYLELAAELEIAAASFTTLGNFAAKVIDLLREFDGIGSGVIEGMLEDIGGEIFDGQFETLRRGASEQITDTHNYSLDGCLSVNSAEFFFDATSPVYLEFIDHVRQAAKDLGPLLGIIALRYVSRTSAKIGMQQFPLTVCIEVAVPRPGSANAEYMTKVHALAAQFGGRPHWGQEHQLDEAHVEELYGKNLETWRWALAETEENQAGTFSSAFTRQRGLETRKTLAACRAERYVAAIVSGVC